MVARPAPPHMRDDSDVKGKQTAVFHVKRVWTITCLDELRSARARWEFKVTRNNLAVDNNNDDIGKRPECGLESSRYLPTDIEFAESFGGGFEYLRFGRPMFSLIHLLEEEDE